MAEGQQEGGPKKITVNVKTPKEKQSVEIEENATIKEVSASDDDGENESESLVLPGAWGRRCYRRSFGAPPGISCQTDPGGLARRH